MPNVSKIDLLADICATTRAEVAQRKQKLSLDAVDALAAIQSTPRGFKAALDEQSALGFGLIAEIKRASPSKGLIRSNFDPASHARAYQAGGATCLSVLTDTPYFQGCSDDLIAARAACDLPVLRKDFMLDPWQVVEARALGADAILIIMAAVDDALACELEAVSIEYAMDVLVEVHDMAEMERAHRLKSRLIGVNNRNLSTFKVDFQHTFDLFRHAPADSTFVAESGINNHADIIDMATYGIRDFLVGESLMRQDNLKAATRTLLGH